jgi:hypothetical protein
MTIPYNATWYSCFVKFLNLLREKKKINYNDLDFESQKKIKKTHKKFYEDIKKNLKKEFYGKVPKNMKKFSYVKIIKVNKHEYKINFGRHRDKYVEYWYTYIDDLKKTEIANEANNMHYLDSLLVSHILSNLEVLTIHDCFGVRLCELHKLMDLINVYYNKHTKEKTYGLHLII